MLLAFLLSVFLLLLTCAISVASNSSVSNSSFLARYSLQFQRCHTTRTYGDATSNSVLQTERFVTFRLCPNNNNACQSSYGEYLVDLETYLHWMVQYYQQERCQWYEANCLGAVESRNAPLWDCSSLTEECQTINGNDLEEEEDAKTIGQCQKFHEFDEQGGALYAAPICTSQGSEIAIGLFADDKCQFLDQSKNADDYLDGEGHPILEEKAYWITHTFQFGSTNLDCQLAEVSPLCQALYDAAAKCESPNNMTDGMRTHPGVLYHNQLAQEAEVCDFIRALQEEEATHTSTNAPIDTSIARARHGHRRASDHPTPSWREDCSLKLSKCETLLQWNHQANDTQDVRLVAKRLIHYKLCPKEECVCPNFGQCGAVTNDTQCGLYTVDYYELMKHRPVEVPIYDHSECHVAPGQNSTDGLQLFLGAYCSDYGTSMSFQFGLFTDNTCTVFADRDEIPASLLAVEANEELLRTPPVTKVACIPCPQHNICDELYPMSGKCETQLSPHPATTSACEYLGQPTPTTSVASWTNASPSHTPNNMPLQPTVFFVDNTTASDSSSPSYTPENIFLQPTVVFVDNASTTGRTEDNTKSTSDEPEGNRYDKSSGQPHAVVPWLLVSFYLVDWFLH